MSIEGGYPNYSYCHLIVMAFWFGVTSMIRPTGLERIPSSFILASMKQGLSAAASQSQTQHSRRTPQPFAYRPRSSEPRGRFTPSFGGAGTIYNNTPRDRYLFLKCSDDGVNVSVSRVMERGRDSSTYCITGTDYEWMPVSAHRPDHKWKRS
jgi:hypothetical protein